MASRQMESAGDAKFLLIAASKKAINLDSQAGFGGFGRK